MDRDPNDDPAERELYLNINITMLLAITMKLKTLFLNINIYKDLYHIRLNCRGRGLSTNWYSFGI